MADRLLCHLGSDHYRPQLDIGETSWGEIQDLLQESDKKRSLVLCSASIQDMLDEVHSMSQVLEILVCEEHVPALKAALFSNYPKVKLVSLHKSSWKASAYHTIAASWDTLAQNGDRLEVLKAARQAADEFVQQGSTQNNTAGTASDHQPST